MSTGAVDLDAVRPAIDAAGRGLILTSFSACEETLVRSEKPRFGGELHALHGRAHAAQLVQEHFEHCMGYVELNNEDRSSRNCPSSEAVLLPWGAPDERAVSPSSGSGRRLRRGGAQRRGRGGAGGSAPAVAGSLGPRCSRVSRPRAARDTGSVLG